MSRRSTKRIFLPNRLTSKGKNITYSIRSSFGPSVLVTTPHPTYASSLSRGDQPPNNPSSPVTPQPTIHTSSIDPGREYGTITHLRTLTPRTLGQVISSMSPISVDPSIWPSFMTGLLPPTPLLLPPPPLSTSTATFLASSSNSSSNPHHDDQTAASQLFSSVPTQLLQQMASLARHIAFQGFMQGIGTDIALFAFGKIYHLHRLILAQSPFFDSMIHGPWKERAQTQIDLTLDDPNITLEGFEIALGRMYGIWTVEADDDLASHAHQHQEEEQEQKQSEFTVVFAGTQALYASRLTPHNALSVLAAATYMGIDSLCAQCTAYIIRTLSASRIIDYVRLSHRHSYHPWSSQIADACHTFLCRSGFDDPRIQCLGVFERLPVEWLVKVIGSDAFWVPSEWDRYLFCRRIVERRRRMRHQKKTVRRKGGGRRGKGKWGQQGCLDKEQHNGAGDEGYDDDPDEEEEEEGEEGDEEAVYERLFSTSIVYMHMALEQLQLILKDYDPWTGRPFTLSHMVHESFWRQTEFRALIESADRKSAVLGLTTAVRVVPQSDVDGQYIRDSDSVPDKDAIAVAPAVLPFNDPKRLLHESETTVAPSQLYSACSPFRFSVQFEDVTQLDVGVRMSSNSFYYAG